MYLNDAIVFDATPAQPVRSFWDSVIRLREDDLNVSPSKPITRAQQVAFVGRSISSSRVRSVRKKIEASNRMPMPTDVFDSALITADRPIVGHLCRTCKRIHGLIPSFLNSIFKGRGTSYSSF